MAGRRRHFGSVRKLPSGRWQASYWHNATRHTAARTFGAKADAYAWLSATEVEIRRGVWVDPAGGRVGFGAYAEAWLDQRHDLRPRTIELYRSLLTRHLLPTFAAVPLADISTARVRAWHAGIARTHPSTAAKAYRLLRVMLATAVADGLLVVNPCVVKGAGQERADERRIPTIDTVRAIADAVSPRYRALVLTAAFAGLRSGELAALERRHIDLVHRTVTVERQAQTVVGQGRVTGPPKSAAGVRTVAIPGELVTVLNDHLAAWVGPEPSALLFTGDKGAPIRTQHWSRRFRAAAESVGEIGLHFHDLRHLAGTLAATTGASTRELMARLGHSTPRAALIYQHATEERDHQIARGIDDLLAATGRAAIADVVAIEAASGGCPATVGKGRPKPAPEAPRSGPTLHTADERRNP